MLYNFFDKNIYISYLARIVMVSVKEKDFVQITYTGKIKDSGKVFDTTEESVAKKEGLLSNDSHHHFGPMVVAVGSHQLVEGLEKQIIGKEVGKEFTVDIRPREAFGERNSEVVKVIPVANLTKEKINPFPGLQLDFGGKMGTVKTVSGGRVTIDFNHTLAGKEISYTATVLKIVEGVEEKVGALLFSMLHTHKDDYELKVEDKNVSIKLNNPIPDQLKPLIKQQMETLLSGVTVSFN